MHTCTYVHVGQKRVSGVLSYFWPTSLSQGLSLNVKLTFSQGGWKPAILSDPLVSHPSQSGGLCPIWYIDAANQTLVFMITQQALFNS